MRIALIFGGRSGEHDVSVVSARSVAKAIDARVHELVPMAIDRTGLWAEPDVARHVLEESGDRADQVVDFAGVHRLDPRLTAGATLDLAFPVLHGPFGEDGTVQGLFEMLGLPYVGCSVTSSAACMDKIVSKRLLTQAGLATPQWREITAQSWLEDPERMVQRALELGLPLFVKPACLGSSVGISKVSSDEALCGAVELALGFDHRVIVECAIDARELEVAVLGAENARASVPGEIVAGHEFYDYADKYLDNDCQLLAPAPLDEPMTDRVRRLALKAYGSLGCDGMARVDFFLERGTNKLWVNELNTIPGFTSISMFPKLWELTDLPYPRLIEALIELAVQRHDRRSRRTTSGHHS